jgi:hypothetical protein
MHPTKTTVKIRGIAIGLMAIAALLFGACSFIPTTSVEPADGPAAAESTPPVVEGGNTEEEIPPHEEITEEPTEEPSEPAVATFKDKYTYEDGVEVEVTKINHGKVTRADAEYAEVKAGSEYVTFTIRVKNGSKTKLDASNTATLSYGPDGEAAKSPSLYSLDTKDYDVDMSGKILPGRSKTAVETLLIPAKYQKDPVLEYSFDFEHEAAIFSGPVR